jgi:hypothetical protein
MDVDQQGQQRAGVLGSPTDGTWSPGRPCGPGQNGMSMNGEL